MQGQFMLVFTLGPVQIFIAQARKTRDLWTGSWLLSKLMEAAMRDVQGTFIFPKEQTVEEIPDIPNKYIAVFDTLAQAQGAVKRSQRQIKDEWQRICRSVWQKIITRHQDEETLEIWLRQTGVDPTIVDPSEQDIDKVRLDALFETYWAIVDRQENEVYLDYGLWLKATEERLAARKNLRDFKPREEPGEKSSISGEREILRGRNTDPAAILQFWLDVATADARSPKDIDQEGKERLDAIDIVKRFAMEAKAIRIDGKPFQKPFPSTSSIATASFVEGLLHAVQKPSRELEDALRIWYAATGQKLISNARDTARDIPYLGGKATSSSEWILQRDGDLYFAETFVPRRLKENYAVPIMPDGEILAKRGSDALKVLLRATDEHNITRPTAYYSVLQMDGDNMGILISGVKDRSEHSQISAALSNFARTSAVEFVEKRYTAKLVYAGGDDVLAFAPLARDALPDAVAKGEPRQVLDLADQLQQRYQQTVKKALQPAQNAQDEERNRGVTASTGIVIAHHLTPLSYVLRSAREAESSAKNSYGRNALVVTLIRRSGEQTSVGCHWSYPGLDREGQPVALFSEFYKLFKEDILSPKCIYTLLEEAPALVKEAGPDPAGVPSAMQSEIKRVLKRQRDPRQKDRFPDEQVEQYARYLTYLVAAMDVDTRSHLTQGELPSVELYAPSRRYGLVEVLGWLLVMVFLARKEQE